jgi:hypothetical protein
VWVWGPSNLAIVYGSRHCGLTSRPAQGAGAGGVRADDGGGAAARTTAGGFTVSERVRLGCGSGWFGLGSGGGCASGASAWPARSGRCGRGRGRSGRTGGGSRSRSGVGCRRRGWYKPAPDGDQEGHGEHAHGGVPVPRAPFAYLVLVQPYLSLGDLERLLHHPALSGGDDHLGQGRGCCCVGCGSVRDPCPGSEEALERVVPTDAPFGPGGRRRTICGRVSR